MAPKDIEVIRSFEKPSQDVSVVIIGAGLSGLCAAYEFNRLGISTTIIEAENHHIGGRVRTQFFEDGLYGEFGPMRISKLHDLTIHYLNEFSIPTRKFIQTNSHASILVRDTVFRASEADRARILFNLPSDELSLPLGNMWQVAVAEVLNNLTSEEKIDLFSPNPETNTVKELDNFSYYDLFVRAGLSKESIHYMASVWGLESYFTTAATQILREVQTQLWEGEFFEIVGGMQRLPQTFSEKVSPHLRMGCRVREIHQLDSQLVRVIYSQTSDSTTLSIDANWVICTVPLGPLQSINIEPKFSAGKRDAIGRISYHDATKILAVAKNRFWEKDDNIFGGGSFSDAPLQYTWYPSDNSENKDPAITSGLSRTN